MLDLTDFDLIVSSAVRYALPRHSYIVWTTQEFLRKNWNHPTLTRMHSAILNDIKEHVDWSSEVHNLMHDYDIETWKNLYNELSDEKI